MILYGHRLPDNQMAVLQLLQALNRKDADINEIGKILQTDPQLSFRLLQMVNSSAMGCTTKVTSIQRAIMMLGLDRIRNWTSLLALGRLDSKPRALQEQAMTRAFTAQELAGSNPSLEPDTALHWVYFRFSTHSWTSALKISAHD
jgi:EAL and modified HD-GYP domain-containing signal transduction protein